MALSEIHGNLERETVAIDELDGHYRSILKMKNISAGERTTVLFMQRRVLELKASGTTKVEVCKMLLH